MKRLMILVVVVATLLNLGLQQGVAQSFVLHRRPVRDGNTGLAFRDMAGFTLDTVKIDQGERFQYVVDYIPPTEGKLQITLFDLNDPNTPNGPDSQMPKTWSVVNKAIFWGKVATRDFDRIEEGPDTIVTIGEGDAGVRFLKSTITSYKGAKEDINLHYASAYRGYSITIEASFPKSRQEADYADLEKFLAEFGKMFKR
jgi:hypothetical protein